MSKQQRQWSILDFGITRQIGENVGTLVDIVKKEEVDSFLCPLCQFDLTKFNINARSVHVNRCIDPPVRDIKESSTKKKRKIEKKQSVGETITIKEETANRESLSNEGIVIKIEETETETETIKEETSIPKSIAASPQPKSRKRSGKPKPPIPEHKILKFPGASTIIAVDAFCYSPNKEISVYLLTHFHSDHYGGLCKSWDNGLLIVCTPITARLLQHKFKYPAEKLFILQNYGQKYKLNDLRITVFDANHCPGAGIFVIEYNDIRYLHCGDFRANEEMIKTLNTNFPMGFNRCYLDTTYYNPTYKFPKQSDIIKFTSDWIKLKCQMHKSTQRRVIDFFTKKNEGNVSEFLIVIGTYSIGKEKLALGIANSLNTNILCTKEKYETIKLYEWDELSSRIKTGEKHEMDCGVHLLPISKTKKAQMIQYLKKYSNKYKSILVIVPTGWTFGYTKDIEKDNTREGIMDAFERGFNNISKSEINGGLAPVRKIQVPYSEHSSYSELCMFVHGLNYVNEWIATVNMQSIDNSQIANMK